MSRSFFVNGESLVTVKGRSDSGIGSLQQLGLAEGPIEVSLEFNHDDIKVDAWGKAPPEVQWMLATATISMSLVHFDQAILNFCIQESMGGAPAIGAMGRAGRLMGNGLPRFSAGNPGNFYIGLNIASPVAGFPYRFLTAYLANNPEVFPLGTERSVVRLNWRAIPYDTDLWNSGMGAQGKYIWDFTADS